MYSRYGYPFLVCGLVLSVVAPDPVRADATLQQQVSFEFAFIKMHGNTTEATTLDKRRTDTDMHCEGFMSMLCGNAQSGEIIRLDRDLKWSLEPKKKEYRETPFLTQAQRQAAEQQAQAMAEKMKQCPGMQSAAAPAAPDTSNCTALSAEVKPTDTHAMFAGHDARLTQVALTQSCTNPKTGAVCNVLYMVDSWLTQDQIAGVDEDKAFQAAYRRKLGLGPENEVFQKQMQQFLTPYKAGLKQLASKSEDLKGYPLKSTFRVAYGGEHCSKDSSGSTTSTVGDASQAAGNAATSSAASAAGTSAGSALSNATGNNAGSTVIGSAANAFASKLVGGMFKRNSSAATPASAAPAALPPGMVQVAAISVETTSINAAAVAPSQFDVPPDWKLIVPPPQSEKEFSCPKGGA